MFCWYDYNNRKETLLDTVDTNVIDFATGKMKWNQGTDLYAPFRASLAASNCFAFI
jgi:hypothetical protein